MAAGRISARWRAAAFFAISLVTLAGAFYLSLFAWEKHDSSRWPHVAGSIVSHRSTHTCGGSRSAKTWEPRIVYRYRVDGAAHEASRIGRGGSVCDDDRREIDAWLKQHYPVGKAVEVYYNPYEPDAAFLRPGGDPTVEIVFALLSLSIAGLMGWGTWRTLKNAASTDGREGPPPSNTRRVVKRFRFQVRRR